MAAGITQLPTAAATPAKPTLATRMGTTGIGNLQIATEFTRLTDGYKEGIQSGITSARYVGDAKPAPRYTFG